MAVERKGGIGVPTAVSGRFSEDLLRVIWTDKMSGLAAGGNMKMRMQDAGGFARQEEPEESGSFGEKNEFWQL